MKRIFTTLMVCGIALGCGAQTILASAELGAENINEIKVEGSFCDVYAVKGDQAYFKGIIEGRGNEGDFSFETNIEGSALVIRVERNYTKKWKNLSLRRSRIDITVPENVKLEIDNSSGDIYVNGLTADFSRIEASSGDVSLNNIAASLEVETSSGDINIQNMTGDLKMESTSGDQEIDDHTGLLDTRASSGDISIADFEGKLIVEATSGDIKVREGSGTLQIRTTSGDITGGKIELTGDSRLKASSGTIELDFVNGLETLSFDLSATSGDLSVGSRSGEKQLIMKRGGYLVTGVTSSGDQSYDN